MTFPPSSRRASSSGCPPTFPFPELGKPNFPMEPNSRPQTGEQTGWSTYSPSAPQLFTSSRPPQAQRSHTPRRCRSGPWHRLQGSPTSPTTAKSLPPIPRATVSPRSRVTRWRSPSLQKRNRRANVQRLHRNISHGTFRQLHHGCLSLYSRAEPGHPRSGGAQPCSAPRLRACKLPQP